MDETLRILDMFLYSIAHSKFFQMIEPTVSWLQPSFLKSIFQTVKKNYMNFA